MPVEQVVLRCNSLDLIALRLFGMHGVAWGGSGDFQPLLARGGGCGAAPIPG